MLLLIVMRMEMLIGLNSGDSRSCIKATHSNCFASDDRVVANRTRSMSRYKVAEASTKQTWAQLVDAVAVHSSEYAFL